MLPLKRPKSLLKIAGKPIIEHALSCLKGIEEVVVISGHKGSEVQEFLESQSLPKISVVEQKDQLGTFHALLQAKPLLKDRFLVMNGDDLYSSEDVRACMAHPASILASPVADPKKFGILETENKLLKRILEKPANPPSSLANTGMFVLDQEVFDSVPEKTERGELELTDAVSTLAQKKKITVVEASGWHPIGYPWHMLEANEMLLKSLESRNEGVVEKGAVLKGSVAIGKNTLVKSGSYIEGPVLIGDNCTIGPNCYIRPFTTIGDNCKVGNAVEIKNSVIGDSVSIGHLSYFGDSVLGDNINVGGGTIAANLRHDNEPVKVMINSSLISTGRRKFGCVIGDGASLGVHTTIYPGRKLGTNTLPRAVVKEDTL